MKTILINDGLKIENNEKYAVCLGIFDGIHLGHRALIEKTVSIAKEKNIKSSMLTFYKKAAGSKIQSLETQINIVRELGIDTFFILDFNEELKNKSPEEFIDEYLVSYIKAKEVICGFNYRFGKDRKGSSDTLKAFENKGYNLTVVPEVKIGEETVSSTLIKKYLSEGNVKKANLFLSGCYMVEGCVREGKKIGRTINFPTVNICAPYECCNLKAGVYAVDIEIDGNKYHGISNIGKAPTVRNSDEIVIETYIIDFSSDVYNKNVKVYFKDFIREEKKFQSLEELKETISLNLETAKKILKEEII